MNPPTHKPGDVAGLAREIRSAWMDGAPPDAGAVLAQHPALAADRSAVLELAYEEFCLRREAGESLDPEGFCARFPQVRAELRAMLSTDQALAARRSITRDEPTRQLTVWPSPGDDVGHCRLLRELGRGAFSRVYLARERSAGDRPVALKLCRAADVEAHTLGRLHHPHIVPILWAGRDEAWALDVVCMPFLGSVTFADLLARLYPSPHSPPPGPASVILTALAAVGHPDDPEPDLLLAGPDLRGRTFAEGVARLALPLAEALEFLHGRGLYHCDVKPSNLLLTARGRPLLLDFNLSRADGVTPRLVGGTFQYMAPEQLRAHADRRRSVAQTAQSDLFSLGVILYELLTGRVPFGRAPAEVATKDLPAWLLARMPAGAVPLSRLNPYVPARLGELIGRCLELDAALRPTTAEVVRALRPGHSRPAWPAVVAAGALLAAATVLGDPWGGPRETPSPEPPSVVDPAPAERASAQAALERGGGLVAAGRREEGRVALRDATARFRRLLDLNQQLAGPAPGAWKDEINQAYTLILLGTPADAEAHLASAEEALRGGLLRAAASSLSPLAALGSLPATAEGARHLGQVLAGRAFCSALQGRHAEAILFGRRALDLGTLDARVLNNLGYSEMMRGDLAQARHHLGQALCLEPELCPALFNACQVAFREGLRSPRAAVPEFLLEDLEAALAVRQRQRLPEPAELYRLAAQVYARAALDPRQAATDPASLAESRRREQRALEYLERSCVLGLDPELVSRDDFLRRALGEERLQPERLRALRQQDAVPVVTLYLADPLGGPVR